MTKLEPVAGICRTVHVRLLLVVTLFALALAGCGVFGDGDDDDDLPVWDGLPDLGLQSDAFGDGGLIPIVYTCDGDDISPPLSWSASPEGTVALVLSVDDPDAPRGTVAHWLLYNIPPDTTSLPADIERAPRLENGALQGETRTDVVGYRGPCPPRGEEHGYRFTLYAVDAELDLESGADRLEVVEAIESHIIAGSQIVGRYQRR